MKRLLALSGLVAGISGCAIPPTENLESTIDNSLEEVVEETLVEETAFKKPEKLKPYFLGTDQVRLDGLRDFYLASVNGRTSEKSVKDNLVFISVGEKDEVFLGHGYLINDCGLILTSNHVVEELNRHGETNGIAFTRDDEIYPIRRTELSDIRCDYAILSAETGLESKVHPLNFEQTFTVPCGNNASFLAKDYSTGSELVYYHEGNVLCVEDIVGSLRGNGVEKKDHIGKVLGWYLRQGGVFLDVDLKNGHSGSPVFTDIDSDLPSFLGLVRGGVIKKGEHNMIEGLIAITGASEIQIGILSYLLQEGALKYEDLNTP